MDTLPTGQLPTLAESFVDIETGVLFVHKDMPPVEQRCVTVALGDVASWARYVTRFGGAETVCSWSARGLEADLLHPERIRGRVAWVATMPFEVSTEWKEWTAFANGQPVAQKTAVEKLEELADDILDPPGADLLNLLRALRASASATATTELRPDGTSAVRFESENNVRTAGMNAGERLELPATLTIAIPVLRGDVDRWRVTVRLRVSVDSAAHLALRFAIQGAERVMETVYAERVNQAQTLLGDGFELLRGA